MNGSPSPVMDVIQLYWFGHKRILTYLQKMTDEQLHWRPVGGNLSIAWHAWHLARWADYLQACMPGMTPELGRRLAPGKQIWHTEGLAGRWEFDATQLGFGETGMEMPDDVALRLPFPAKTELLDYVERAFAAADSAVKAIDEEQFQSAEQPQPMTEGIWEPGTIGNVVLTYIVHDYRHLGNMECLLGLQGQPGTATS
jgi:DinB family protein